MVLDVFNNSRNTVMTSTNHKDILGNEIFIGDKIVIMDSGKYSSWLKEATVVGTSDKMIRVKYMCNGNEMVASRAPHNTVLPKT